MRLRSAFALLPVLVAVAACSSRPHVRLGGDVGGVPVQIQVTYDREALDALTDGGAYQRTVIVGQAFWPGPYTGWYSRPYGRPYSHYHPWYGSYAAAGWAPYEPTTRLALLVGRGPGEAQHLRATLTSGTWSWTVPMAEGSSVHVAIQASGGRSGWTDLGSATVAPGLTLDIDLSGATPALHTTTAPTGG